MADLTTQLIEIRDDIRSINARLDNTNERIGGVNERLDNTNGRLDGLNERLDSTNGRIDNLTGRFDRLESRFDRLERRQTEAEVRLSTEIVGVIGAIDRLTEAMLDPGSYAALAARGADHDRRIGVLETR